MTSTCPKCLNTSFEVKEAVPHESVYQLLFVQCASCGAVVGVTDYLNVSARLDKLAEKLGVDLD